MGWSCCARAAWTLDAWTAACLESTGSQNVFRVNNERYFFETSRKEHSDGAITGTVWRFLPDDKHVRRCGSFRIEGDGSVTRAPKFLKDASPTKEQLDKRYNENYVMPYCQTRALADSLR